MKQNEGGTELQAEVEMMTFVHSVPESLQGASPQMGHRGTAGGQRKGIRSAGGAGGQPRDRGGGDEVPLSAQQVQFVIPRTVPPKNWEDLYTARHRLK